MASSDGRLVWAEVRLDGRAETASNNCPKKTAEARGELQRPHAGRFLSVRLLEYPDQKVYGRPQDFMEGVIVVVSSVERLPQEAGDKADARVVCLVGLRIGARGAARRRQDHRS